MKVYGNRYQETDPLFYSVPDPEDPAPEGWYFWDETWSKAYGPYALYEVAKQNLRVYIEKYLGETNDETDQKD
jgi:hypothetical protein